MIYRGRARVTAGTQRGTDKPGFPRTLQTDLLDGQGPLVAMAIN
jgi:hypothetical protein